jgi:hypothetical protein
MNGKKGVVEGLNLVGALSLFVKNRKRFCFKPENLRSASHVKESVSLTDIQDRLGSISLHEVIMKTRVDVADFLLKQHNTSIYLQYLDGASPFNMTLGMGTMSNEICTMVMKKAQKNAEESRKAKKRKGAYLRVLWKGIRKSSTHVFML